MDKNWMDAPRHTQEYLQGLARFLGYAFAKSSVENKILCPCKSCVNSYWREERIVLEHLVCEGFIEGYKQWIFHAERGSSLANEPNLNDVEERDEGDDISDLLRDLAGGLDDSGDFEDDGSSDQDNVFLESLHKLEADSSQELYPGCKNYSKLRFLVRLLHTKLLGGWSDKSFNLLLDLLKDAYPLSAIPKNYNEAKKLVKCLGLGYVNIHACENDCILFWKDNANANSCPKCKASRWKSERKYADGKRVHKAPKKIGMDVLLYAWNGLESPVAKATILSIDPDTFVSGEPLGPETYEVLVNVAIRRDATLPYQYDDLRYIGDAVTRSIAWPSSKMKPYKPGASASSRR